MPVEGSFHLYDYWEQCLAAVEGDGVPRYAVCGTETLRKLCAPHESVRDGAQLYLKPDPVSPWFYVNSSALPKSAEQNISTNMSFNRRNFISSAEGREFLQDANNVAVFGVIRDVSKRSELLLEYPLPSRQDPADGMDDAETRGDGKENDAGSAGRKRARKQR